MKMINNPTSLNWILPRFIHNFSSYEHVRRLGHVPFSKGHFWACFKFKSIFVKHKGSIKKQNNMGASDFKTLDFLLHKFFAIWYPVLICSYLGSLISYRNVFVLQMELWIPFFIWIISSLLACLKPKKVGKKCGASLVRFFLHSPFNLSLLTGHLLLVTSDLPLWLVIFDLSLLSCQPDLSLLIHHSWLWTCHGTIQDHTELL